MSAPSVSGRTTGFTLVEVLVALVVTSLLLAIIFDAAVTARERGRSASDKNEAVMLARQLLAEASVTPFAEGVRDGEAAMLRWRISERTVATDPRRFFVLAEIEVAISNARGKRLLDVTTRKIKPVAGS